MYNFSYVHYCFLEAVASWSKSVISLLLVETAHDGTSATHADYEALLYVCMWNIPTLNMCAGCVYLVSKFW